MVDWNSYIPKVSFASSTLLWVVIVIFVIFIIAGIIAFILNRLQYKYTIVVFEKVGAYFQPTRKEKAREIKIGSIGDTIFRTNKSKKYLPNPRIQTGKRTYWYAIREDGEYINIGLEDVDFLMKKAKVHYLDKEMRHSRTALDDLFKNRYNKPTFLSTYGGLIAYSVLIVITIVMFWLLMDKFLDITQKVSGVVETAGKLLDKQGNILEKMNNVCTGGSGLQPA